MIVGVDIGDTFTDVVAFDGLKVSTAEVATTRDQSKEMLAGALELADSAESLLLGTTTATNTLLERKGARLWLLSPIRVSKT